MKHIATSPIFSRRAFLRSATASSLLFPGIMHQLLADSADPLAPRLPHFPAKAKNIIFLFMTGGVSHVDTFDPKPELTKQHGKEIDSNHPSTKDRPDYNRIFLKRPQWEFKPHGQCGTEVSSLFPHVAGCVDDLALIRSMHTSHANHYNATLGMHSGSFTVARPSIGSWMTYGLGTLNRNLPGFIVIAPAQTYAGTQVYASDFLPGAHQGTLVVPGAEPVVNVRPRVPTDRQQLELASLRELNAEHLATRENDPQLLARLQTFETAFGMQMAVPDAFDFKKETESTLASYGLKRDQKTGFGWQCLAARRLVERGVRFVELIDTGSSNNWDAHGDMLTHEPLAKNVDQPIAALLRDLKQRGMLNDTLVVWTTEFGRTPFNNSADHKGREHHPLGFSSWLAGGGVKPGIVYGATDEIGMNAVEKPVHVRDFHATILHLMGLDHERLTYRHAGLDFKLTGVEHAKVVKGVLA
jgi:hypothetical protein